MTLNFLQKKYCNNSEDNFENFMKLEGKLNKLKQVQLPTIEGYSSNLTSLTLDNLDNQHTSTKFIFLKLQRRIRCCGAPTISDLTITKQVSIFETGFVSV